MSLPGLTFNKINLSSLKFSKSCQWTYRNMESDRNNKWNMDNFQPVLAITCYEMAFKGKRCLLFSALQGWGVIYRPSKPQQQKLFTYSWSPQQPTLSTTTPETTTVQFVQSTQDNMVGPEHPSIGPFLAGHLISATHPKAKKISPSDPSFTSTLAFSQMRSGRYLQSVFVDLYNNCEKLWRDESFRKYQCICTAAIFL